MAENRSDRDDDALERATRIGRHFERARDWGAIEDAERRHRAEKGDRPPAPSQEPGAS